MVGVDYDPDTAAAAVGSHGAAGLRTECADGSMLGLRTDAFDDVCSSHLIEHFDGPGAPRTGGGAGARPGRYGVLPHPERAGGLREPLPRVPVHPGLLREMLGRHFASVEVRGLDATETVKEDFATRRAMAEKMLRLDPLGLRHRLPRRAFVWLHATGRRIAYRYTNTDQTGGASGITEEEFFLTDDIDDTTLVLFAVCREPR